MNAGTRNRFGRLTGLTGVAAVVGAILWSSAPWAQYAVFGDRPYLGTAFDVIAFVGLVLLLLGVAGVRASFRANYGRIGAAGVGASAAGIAVVATVVARSVVAFVAAGFEPVPATGEDPAGLLVVLAWTTGMGLLVVGTGLVGVALLRRVGGYPVTTALLLSTPAVPAVVVTLDLLSLLPSSVGTLAVRTNAVFLPAGLAWIALGGHVWSRSRLPADATANPDEGEP